MSGGCPTAAGEGDKTCTRCNQAGDTGTESGAGYLLWGAGRRGAELDRAGAGDAGVRSFKGAADQANRLEPHEQVGERDRREL